MVVTELQGTLYQIFRKSNNEYTQFPNGYLDIIPIGMATLEATQLDMRLTFCEDTFLGSHSDVCEMRRARRAVSRLTGTTSDHYLNFIGSLLPLPSFL